ncbi:hypothetical protein MCOR27_006884 [Pyricularia oryzae]|uniref:TMEM205-like domain-containing protein n=5 Tax=Pyricularia TaxID=48558 RepID=A0ABQ8N367_PYRGI|nr:uncharacterized protein MGG_10156 [Pyricularia oryzae 70-15]ELQ44460.1 hypothetical protein OOU_Y34scaffold00087g38 [Pyricularia oryzae Y34]KAH8837282.1 hypothetical protein MCOR01_010916 [Pyricularia oryzae]KAI6290476.1 hypothetical protein MCOR33_011276 [Pyricularia grisea]EHA53988.1 hypothetical protein MGG_10156 [Pyricularia oryzae 70-15]KAH9438048.1 hypothetical protein MCOR02_001689 [Pyricularia oryzae]
MAERSLIFSPAPYHIISYGTLLGTTFFQSFVNGIVAFRALPRPQFSILQQKIFPVYFVIQSVLPVTLALTWPGSRNGLLSTASGIAGVLDEQNRWGVLVPIGTMFVTGVANLLWLLPATTGCMLERRVQEKKDGKRSYDPAPHSEEMKALNKKFGILHGISSLLNLGTFIALICYGFTLAGHLH